MMNPDVDVGHWAFAVAAGVSPVISSLITLGKLLTSLKLVHCLRSLAPTLVTLPVMLGTP